MPKTQVEMQCSYPAPAASKAALKAAKGIKILILDVDGVLTDGGLYYDADGRVTKRFHVHDGMGIKLAQAAGIEVAVITGLSHPATENRVRELGIDEYHHGFKMKMDTVNDILQRKGLTLEEAAYVGDDWVDAAPMARVALPMCVADAQPEIKDLALWSATRNGGHGAVREAIRFILETQDKMTEQFSVWS